LRKRQQQAISGSGAGAGCVESVKARGFTLIELLVALSIFAVLSVMAYSGLRAVLDAREQATGLAQQLARLQMAVTVIGRDVEQSVARPVRDRFGDPLPAMVQGGEQDAVLEFTRVGRRNPMARPRSDLQRVAYTLKDEELYRVTWPVLDRAQNTESHESVLLEKVKNIELRFLDKQGNWNTFWPPSGIGANSFSELPKAVEVALELENWGKITRLLPVPGA